MAETKLVNMHIDPKTREEKYAEAASSPMGDSLYPYGLSLSLDEEALDLLGMDTLPKVDGEMLVYAKATVTSVSSHESTGADGKRRSVSLQITDLCVEPATKKKSNADVLFKE